MEPVAVFPFLVLLVGGTGIRLLTGHGARVATWSCVFGEGVALLLLWGDRPSYYGVFLSDRLSQVLGLLLLAGLALTLSVSTMLAKRKASGPETMTRTFSTVILSAAGMVLSVSSRNLLVISFGVFLALRSLAALREDDRGFRRAFTRINLTALALVTLALAMLLIDSGSLDLAKIETAMFARGTGLVSSAGLVLFLMGLLIQGIVPLVINQRPPHSLLVGHSLPPPPSGLRRTGRSLGEGGPHSQSSRCARAEGSVLDMLMILSQVSLFGVLLRITGWLITSTDLWGGVLAVSAVLAMVVGSAVALRQNDLRRLLLTASATHSGYLLLGVLIGGDAARSAVLAFLPGFIVACLAAYSAAVSLGGPSGIPTTSRGLGWTRPVRGVTLGICALSLAGLPPTGGFMGRFRLFDLAVGEGQVALVVVALISTAVGFYLYSRIPIALFMESSDFDPAADKIHFGWKIVWTGIVVAVVALGILPESWLALAGRAALEFF